MDEMANYQNAGRPGHECSLRKGTRAYGDVPRLRRRGRQGEWGTDDSDQGDASWDGGRLRTREESPASKTMGDGELDRRRRGGLTARPVKEEEEEKMGFVSSWQ